MELKECKIGILVTNGVDIGHIIGLDINSLGEVVPKVLWASYYGVRDTTSAIHHKNIKPLE